MSEPVEIFGFCPPRFEAARRVFTEHFEQGLEGGARFSFAVEGEVVVDLWAGHADRARTRPFDDRTLTPSSRPRKAITALIMARAVDQGLIDYDQPAAELWPEFAAEGKGGLSVAQVLSHQAGLSGFIDPIDPALWFDWDGLCARLAATAPAVAAGHGQRLPPDHLRLHWPANCIRRAEGRTIGQGACAKTSPSPSASTSISACPTPSTIASPRCSARPPCPISAR